MVAFVDPPTASAPAAHDLAHAAHASRTPPVTRLLRRSAARTRQAPRVGRRHRHRPRYDRSSASPPTRADGRNVPGRHWDRVPLGEGDASRPLHGNGKSHERRNPSRRATTAQPNAPSVIAAPFAIVPATAFAADGATRPDVRSSCATRAAEMAASVSVS